MATSYSNKITITRDHLAKSIKQSTGLQINRASKIVDRIIDCISDGLIEGKEVKIRLFGSFLRKAKNSRTGRNPVTMEEVLIPARTVVKFRVASTLRKRINNNINLIY